MEDKERIITYISGVYIITFLSEWKKSERMGIKAKLYNTISKKHDMFHNQLLQAKRKNKNCSKNCQLFIEANAIAVKGWEKTIKETKGLTISVTTTIRKLYDMNKENFTRIYGIKEEDFIKLDAEEGVKEKAFSSFKMGRILIDSVKEKMNEHPKYKESKN